MSKGNNWTREENILAFNLYCQIPFGTIVVRLSPKIREANNDSKETISWLMSFDEKPLLLPRKFQPDPQLLAIHASISGH